MSSRYVPTLPPVTRGRGLPPDSTRRRQRSRPAALQDRLDLPEVPLLSLVHRPTHQRQQQRKQAPGRSSVLDHRARAALRPRDLPFCPCIQASGTSDRRPGARTHSATIGLPLIHSAPTACRSRLARGELFDAPGPGVPPGLVGDVGEVVEDIPGDRAISTVFSTGHPATLAHVASAPPARGPMWTPAQRHGPHAVAEAADDRPGRLPRRHSQCGFARPRPIRATTASPPSSPAASPARRDRRR
jgi:hypothetical protein